VLHWPIVEASRGNEFEFTKSSVLRINIDGRAASLYYYNGPDARYPARWYVQAISRTDEMGRPGFAAHLAFFDGPSYGRKRT